MWMFFEVGCDKRRGTCIEKYGRSEEEGLVLGRRISRGFRLELVLNRDLKIDRNKKKRVLSRGNRGNVGNERYIGG